ncbi:hypothetical protein [Thiothrix subterranea]|uniref:Uncharacterized protein n=1 Tax=Thiothrix subterranea TaxID=2735563 RepID=A0AA51MKH8_9GAMM|nr:hypothetical protein [Thiothrix subterranea]MDQ5770874.1 hypothetical protein [Thiothrix subterranea]WML86097.1 hypothetical protein RCG00_17585 [Thiothrix subterranea]
MSDNAQTPDSQPGINTLGFASVAKEMQENFKQVEEIMAGFSKAHEGMKLDPFNLKSGSRRFLTPSPHTTLRAAPHRAVHQPLG